VQLTVKENYSSEAKVVKGKVLFIFAPN